MLFANQYKHFHWKLIQAITVFALSLTQMVNAETFYSQRVKNPSKNDGAITSGFSYSWSPPIIQCCADDIKLKETKVVRSVTWWGKFVKNNPPNTIKFNLKFYGDKNGFPDNDKILVSSDIVFEKLFDTGEKFGAKTDGDDIYEFSANLSKPTSLNKGERVWFSLFSDSGAKFGAFQWRFQDGGNNNAIYDARRLKTNEINKELSDFVFDWKYSMNWNFSFELSGALLPGSVVKMNSSQFGSFPYQFRFNSKDDTEYKVEASEDLKQWIQIDNIKGNGKTISYSDKRKAIFSKQFYRVKFNK